MPLFKQNIVYPTDSYGGEYVDLDGTIIDVGEPLLCEQYGVKVMTSEGAFDGFTHEMTMGFPPKIGHFATIRIYNAGGGWYPDNRIISWKV